MYSFVRNQTTFTVGEINEDGAFPVRAVTKTRELSLVIVDRALYDRFVESMTESKLFRSKVQRTKFEGYAKGKIYEAYRRKCKELNLL